VAEADDGGHHGVVGGVSDSFGTVAGSYAVAAGYLSEQGCWLTTPPGEPGAVDEVGVHVVPPPPAGPGSPSPFPLDT
jgi:hypothetical protein